MTVARFFDWFQLATLAGLACLALPRLLVLYARGVRVLAIDHHRTPKQMLADLLSVICLLLWWYEVVAYAWPVPIHFVPPWLGIVLFDAVAVKISGAALWAGGLVIYGLALWAFGDSWRLGIDRSRPVALVTRGIFASTRNPIYVSFNLMSVGTFLIQGRLIFLMLAIFFAGLLHLQILREERFLSQTQGDAYHRYRGRVGRYVTWRSAQEHSL